MSPRGKSVLILLAGVVLLVAGLIGLSAADRGLSIRRFSQGAQPMTFTVLDPEERLSRHLERHGEEPQEDAGQEVLAARFPAVILAHGYAASSKIMQGYQHALAHAGYAVLAFDFSGHGANRAGFDPDRLGEDIDRAYRALIAQPEVDPERVALIGHSMGGGAVMEAALRSPERYRATVAISPVSVAVTPATPRNLQLQAGTWEPRFLRSARQMLERAGGSGTDFATGRAREFVAVAGAEHLSILFRDGSHQAVLRWLDRALEAEIDARVEYRDRRLLWWLAQAVGWLLLLASMRPMLRRDAQRESRAELIRRPIHWVALFVAPIGASLVCAVLSWVIDLRRLAGLPMGGALALWLLLAGVGFLLAGYRVGAPVRRDLLAGAALFGFLWIVIGLSADWVWLQWTLVTPRLLRWPLLGLACIPWFVATEVGQGDPRGRGRWLWWLAQTAALILGLLLLVALVPELALISILLPLLPLVTACLVAAGSRVNRPWAYGIGAGLFFGWLLACSFPVLA